MSERMNMGDVSRRIGYVVTSALLEQLGIPIIHGKGRSVFVEEKHWPNICDALGDYSVSRKTAGPVPKPPKADAPTYTVENDHDEL